MSLRQRTASPETVDPGSREPPFYGAHNKMLRAERDLAGPFTFDLDLQAGIDCRDHDFVVQAERKAEAVEAGAQIRRRGRHHGAGREPGGQGLDHDAGSIARPSRASRRRPTDPPGWPTPPACP